MNSRKSRVIFYWIFFAITIAFSFQIQASVSLKNGNFFIGYTDIVYSGGFEPKIDRIYNSKTPYKGMFGWGWGNEYECYLTVSVDGSVIVHEYGSGAENRFTPLVYKADELNRSVEEIVKIAQKLGVAGDAVALNSYRDRLKKDANFRNIEWEKFRSQGKIQPRQLATGTQLRSNRFSYQYLTKIVGGYIRNFDSGKLEKFDDAGKLQKISDKNGNFIQLSYGKDGHIQKIVDNFNRKIFLEYDNRGLLKKIEGENSKKAEYQYNSLAELIRSQDADGHIYEYKYDTEGHHNLIFIGYSDKTTQLMTYYRLNQNENIKSVKDRDGTLSEYIYKTGSAAGSHSEIEVTMKTSDGKIISKSQYEYFSKRKHDGEEWTEKMVTTLDGQRTETVYNEAFGLPVRIQKDDEITTFDYDQKGHVKRKETPSEVTELTYDSQAGKVSKVSRYFKADRKKIMWAQFDYDKKYNLIFAKNSEGKKVKIIYDSSGRILTLIDQDKKQISFKYNENSKPIQITDPSLGTISVTYTNSGEIKKVESPAGRKIAFQVTSAFQNLLEIIRPAGVNLSF